MKKGFFLPALVFVICVATCFCALATDAPPERIRVAISSISTSQVNVWVPLDTGLFKKYGLDVELVYISGAPVGTAALMSGEVVISQGGVVGSINSNLKGAELTSFSGAPTAFLINWSCLRASNSSRTLKGKDSRSLASAQQTIPRRCSCCRNSASSPIRN